MRDDQAHIGDVRYPTAKPPAVSYAIVSCGHCGRGFTRKTDSKQKFCPNCRQPFAAEIEATSWPAQRAKTFLR